MAGKMAGAEITAESMPSALAAILAWRVSPEVAPACPLCGAAGLAVSDHSARPHAEWYRLVCGACGLDQMLAVPLGAVVPGGEG
jgi:ribosomal protein S27AE